MTTIHAFIKKHALLAYYVLAFAVSWTAFLVVIGGPGRIPGTPDQFQSLLPSAISAFLLGPALAGVILMAVVDGRAGFSELFSRLLTWRVGTRWYAVALLTAPLVLMAIPLALSLYLPQFPGIATMIEKTPPLVLAVSAGIGAGVFEELGWTGFAVPRLRLRNGVFTTGLIAGGLWGAWHFIVNFWSSGTPSGGIALDLLLASLFFSLGVLPPYRVLMVWVYDRTESLLVAMLMHFSLTTGNIMVSGLTGPTWSLVVAASLWAIAAAVAVAEGSQRSRARLRHRLV